MFGWHAEQWAAFGACAAVVVYVVLGLLAWSQLRETRRLRELQTRPYVLVDFEFRRHLIYLVIKNIGTTPARDVTIAFDKPLRGSPAMQRDINKVASLTQPIPMLAPGREIKLAFDSGPQLFKDPELPRAYTVSVTYRDATRKRPYADPPYVLDLSQYAEALLDPKGLPELVGEVEKIRKVLGKWSDGSHGLLAMTVDRERYQARTDRWVVREQAGRARADGGWTGLTKFLWDRALRKYGWR